MPAPQARAARALPDELIEEVLVRVRAESGPRRPCSASCAMGRQQRQTSLRPDVHLPPAMASCGRWTLATAASSSTAAARPGGGFIVWDPITDRRVELPSPPRFLCAATGLCDHLNCHRGPFIVVLVGTSHPAVGSMHVFLASTRQSPVCGARQPMKIGHRWGTSYVGNKLFFGLRNYDRILRYDAEGWTLCKVIDLKDLFRPLVVDLSFHLFYHLVGFAETVCVALMAVQGGLFTTDIKSGLMKKVSEGRGICCAVPYINFCNPALEAPSRDDGQRVGISSGKGGRLKRLKC